MMTSQAVEIPGRIAGTGDLGPVHCTIARIHIRIEAEAVLRQGRQQA
jgi:hypothetical protein